MTSYKRLTVAEFWRALEQEIQEGVPVHDHPQYKRVEFRLWGKIRTASPDACWLWTGVRNQAGYGLLNLQHDPLVRVRAHRLAFMLHNRVDVANMPIAVRHTCDNPPCCNPKHLLPGTYADNARDAMERGRNTIGERNYWAKLTESKVREIRKLRAAGMSPSEAAALYGVSHGTIRKVTNRRTWRHVS